MSNNYIESLKCREINCSVKTIYTVNKTLTNVRWDNNNYYKRWKMYSFHKYRTNLNILVVFTLFYYYSRKELIIFLRYPISIKHQSLRRTMTVEIYLKILHRFYGFYDLFFIFYASDYKLMTNNHYILYNTFVTPNRGFMIVAVKNR